CYPLTVTDHASRYLLSCEALSSTREDFAFAVFERLFKLPLIDRTALHPGGTTLSTLPQYTPWTHNFAHCTVRLNSVFDLVDPREVAGCARRGVHAQGNPDAAEQSQNDLKAQLKGLMGE